MKNPVNYEGCIFLNFNVVDFFIAGCYIYDYTAFITFSCLSVPLPKVVNDTFPETDQKEWISTISKRSQLWYADIIVIDMIDTLKKPGADLDNLDKFLTKIGTSGIDERGGHQKVSTGSVNFSFTCKVIFVDSL